MLVRVAFEQVPYQHSRFEDMFRILLLFDRDYTGLGCTVMSTEGRFSCSGLPQQAFMRAAFLILVGATTTHCSTRGGLASQTAVSDGASADRQRRDGRVRPGLRRRVCRSQAVGADRAQPGPAAATLRREPADGDTVRGNGRWLLPRAQLALGGAGQSPASLYYLALSHWGWRSAKAWAP